MCSWVIPSWFGRGYLPFPHAPRPPAAWAPISAEKFRRTSRVLTRVTFWEWMLFRWEDFKEKESSLPWVLHTSASCVVSQLAQWTPIDTESCQESIVQLKKLQKISLDERTEIMWKKASLILSGYLHLLFHFIRKSTKFYRKQNTEGWQSWP